MEQPYAIEMLNITKRFPGIVANDNITLQLKRGEIHALLGENGAGKSTLMSVLFGLYRPEEGVIKKDGQVVQIKDPNDANALGIGMVHQHFKLVECFSILDNIILGVEPCKNGFLQKQEAREKVLALSEKYGLQVDPDALVEDVTVGMQQRTEILKMLYRDNEILIFDEPTAVLTPQEIDELMQIMKNLAAEGKSILFISHKLNEIMSVADRCTVLRKGKYIGTVNIAETSREELSRMMVGRDVEFAVHKEPSKPKDPILVVEGMTVASKLHNNNAVKNISFTVRAGEIVCIAGIDGNGQTELIYGLTGLEPLESGKITLCGQDITHETADVRARAGMFLSFQTPEEIPGITLESFLRTAAGAIAGKPVKVMKFRHEMAAQMEALNMDPSYADRYLNVGFSGGEKKKAEILQLLMLKPALALLDETDSGLDVDAVKTVASGIKAYHNADNALIIITHNAKILEGLQVDYVHVLDDARIVRTGDGSLVNEIIEEGFTALKEDEAK